MSATKPKKASNRIDDLMERASQALVATKYFECERLAVDALQIAHRAEDYERMSRVLLPLQEARRQKRLLAMDTKKLTKVVQPLDETQVPTAGCYLVEPPMVGVDGRDLRERADAADVPVFVVVREPLTRTGLWPIVMVGPVTVRTKVRPPANDKPTIEWLIGASEALGDEAIASIDPADDAYDRVDQLLECVLTLPDHEKLHQALADACAAAAKQQLIAPRALNKKTGPGAGEWPEDENEA